MEGNPQNPEFRANLALALEGMGLCDKAAATWHGLCELSPANEHIPAARRS